MYNSNSNSMTQIAESHMSPMLSIEQHKGTFGTCINNNSYNGANKEIIQGKIKGSEINYIKECAPYYQMNIPFKSIVPWLGKSHEKTFMNNIKEKNMPIVKTYDYSQLSPLDDNKYRPAFFIDENYNWDIYRPDWVKVPLHTHLKSKIYNKSSNDHKVKNIFLMCMLLVIGIIIMNKLI